MSNFWGKTLLEAKKVGSAISRSAKEIGGAVGEATSNIADHTKKSAKVAMLKAEMEQLYTKLGKSVFNYGLVEENEEGLEIIKTLLDKKAEIEKLEKELDKCEHDHACGHNGPCDCECDCEDCDETCEDNCKCDCHNEAPESETAEDDDIITEDCQCGCKDGEECDCDCHKDTEPEASEDTKTEE